MRPLLYILVLPLILALGCKKHRTDGLSSTTTNCTGSGFTIYCTGNRFINQPLQFSSNIPNCKKITWIFRDGSSSTDISPTHTFTEAGSYWVVVIINDDSLNLNGQNPTLNINVNYPYDVATVAKIGNNRTWNIVEDSTDRNTLAKVTVKKYTDNFAITILNDTTLIFKNDTLKAQNSSLGVYDVYFFSAPGSEFSWKTLNYYFQTDSIVYASHPDQGGRPSKGKMPAIPYGITTTYSTK